MFTGTAIFASVVLWLIVKEKGFRKVVFIGAGVASVFGVFLAIWYYGIQLPRETRKANEEKAKEEAAAKETAVGPWTKYQVQAPDQSQQKVRVQGPDGKSYDFPPGTTKADAIAYFKKKGIGVSQPDASMKESTIPLPRLRFGRTHPRLNRNQRFGENH